MNVILIKAHLKLIKILNNIFVRFLHKFSLTLLSNFAFVFRVVVHVSTAHGFNFNCYMRAFDKISQFF